MIYNTQIHDFEEKRKKELEQEEIATIEFNKLKLNKYLVIDDLSHILLHKLENSTQDSFVTEILYSYDKKNNALEKIRKSRFPNKPRGMRFYKSNLKKESILVNTDDIKISINYLQRLHDSKKYNL